MTRDNQLDDKLWDYVYDLLSEEEKQEWTARITSDPDVARAYAEIALQADMIADAVRIKSTSLRWSGPSEDGAERPEPDVAVAGRASAGGRTRRWGNWLAAAAAVLLIAMLSSAQLQRNSDLALERARVDHLPDHAAPAPPAAPAGPAIHTTVHSPNSMVEGQENWITVQTRDLKNVPRPAEVEVQIQDKDQQTVWNARGQTDENGVWQVSIPAPLAQNEFSLLANTVLAPAANSAILPMRVTPPQFVTHLSTDRKVYAPGESMFMRSVTLTRPNFQDAGEIELDYKLVREGAVLPESQRTERTVRGVGSTKYQLDADTPEGEYSVVASSKSGKFEEAARRVYVERPEDAPWSIDLEFLRGAYSAGDKVVADVAVAERDGAPLSNARLQYRAGVADQLIAEGETLAGPDGTQRVDFELPDQLPVGPGYIEMRAGQNEQWERTFAAIPLERKEVHLEFYPEGGQLAAGLPNRVYFEAQTAGGKPIAVSGHLVDDAGAQVVRFATEPGETTGRGRFDLVPRAGTTYRAVLEGRQDLMDELTLTAVQEDFLATLQSGDGVFDADEPVALTVHANRDGRPLVVAVASGGVTVGQLSLDSRRGEPATIKVPVTDEAEGVLRVTLFDLATSPARALAERLVFRRAAKSLHIEHATPLAAVRGRRASLELQVKDETGAVPDAVVGAVVRQKGRFLGDEDTSSLVADYLLLSEIDEPAAWEDARIYMSDSPTAARSLDRLLATRGWRRLEVLDRTQLAMRFRKSLNNRAYVATEQDLAKEQEALSEPDAVVEAPTLADNMSQVLESAVPPAAPPTATTAAVPPSRLPMAGIGRALLLTSALVALVTFTLAMFQLASVWCWLPTGCLALLSAFVAVQWIGGLERLGRTAPDARMVAQSDAPNIAGGESAADLAPEESEPPPDVAAMANLESAGGIPVAPRADMVGGFGGGALDTPSGAGGLSDPGMAGAMAARGGGPPAPGFGVAGRGEPGAPPPSPLEAPTPSRDQALGDDSKLALAYGDRMNRALQAQESLQLQQSRRSENPALAETAAANQGARSMTENRFAPADVGAPSAAGPQVRRYNQSYFFDARTHEAGPPPATLYWHPLLIPDVSGKVTVEFDVPSEKDAGAAEWELKAAAHGSNRLGEVASTLQAVPPLQTASQLPNQVMVGDRFDARLRLTNHDLQDMRVKAALRAEPSQVVSSDQESQEVAVPSQTDRAARFGVAAKKAGRAELSWKVESEQASTSESNRLTVHPSGYPVSEASAGEFDASATAPTALSFASWQPRIERSTGTVHLTLIAYPSLASEIIDAATHITSAERVSSWTTLAAYKIRNWLEQQRIAQPALQRALKTPANAALNGRSTSDLHEAWELAWFQAEIGAATDSTATRDWPDDQAEPYLVALAARVALLENSPEASRLLTRLAGLQQPDGRLPCERTFVAADSSTTSLEATAMAVLAWSHPSIAAEHEASRAAALAWLRGQRRHDGGFGSADATALTAMALLTDTSRSLLAPVDLSVTIAGQAGDERTELQVAAGSVRSLRWPLELAADRFPAGLTVAATHAMPYVVGVEFASADPPKAPQMPYAISVRLAADDVRLGESTSMRVRVMGRSHDAARISLGLPAGLEPDMRSLPATCQVVGQRLLVRVPAPFAEPREWVKADDVLEFDVPLVATHVGSFTQPPSRVHPEHAPHWSAWSAPAKITVRD